MTTDADLRKEFKLIDERMAALPAKVEEVNANIQALKQ